MTTVADEATISNGMSLLLWMSVGALIGWVASRARGADSPQEIAVGVATGVIGAVLSGWLLTPFLSVLMQGQMTTKVPTVLVSLFGAIGMLALVNLIRPRAARS